MCLSCGCMEPAENHGDKRALTMGRLRKAATAAGLPLGETAWNIGRTLLAVQDPEEDVPLADRAALIFDCDGILAFTAESLCTALNARFATSYNPATQGFFPGTLLLHKLPPDQGGWLAEQMRQPAFVAAYAPDFHALDLLRDAWDAGYSVQVVTERPPELQDVTQDWVRGWGGPPCPVHAVGHGQKALWLPARYSQDRPAVLIDDDPAKQVTVAQPGIDVWAPRRPAVPQVQRPFVRLFPDWMTARYWLRLGPQP